MATVELPKKICCIVSAAMAPYALLLVHAGWLIE
jgi:hypothetical protein